MMRSTTDDDMPGELDYVNAPIPDYTVEDLVNMITLKNLGIEGGKEVMTEQPNSSHQQQTSI
jgi:hypothetical protein